MKVDVLLGLQWGDEGKGKMIDAIADRYDIICRFQGGPNAGHTIVIGEDKYVLKTIPSGVFRPNVKNVIGNGVVLDPITIQMEMDQLREGGIAVDSILLSKKVHLILPTHRLLDAASEASKGKSKIGSTLRGIGPTYMDKTGRNGLRAGDITRSDFKQKYEALKAKHLKLYNIYDEVDFDLEKEEAKWFDSIEKLSKMEMIDCSYYLNEALKSGKRILAEGAQGTMLDIEYGTYPFVTSSNTVTAGVCTGLGIAPKHIGKVIGIVKAYTTRVGGGPFPTELHDEVGEELRRIGHEFGAVTGRPRRTGWLDLPQLKYALMINGVDTMVITKMDCLNSFESIKVAEAYEYDGNKTEQIPFDLNSSDLAIHYAEKEGWNCDLEGTNFDEQPDAFKNYIKYLEEKTETPVSFVSVGPARRSTISKAEI